MTPTVLFVPGLRDHVADHWQTLLEARLENAACVPRLGKENLSLDAWVEALDKAYAALEGPVVLVAHSAGVMMVAHWAKRFQRRVAGALLATPPDFDTPLPAGYPSLQTLAENGWAPVPRTALPFPSLVVASTNDPLGRLDRVIELARDWESQVVNAGAVGHLNPASGFGEWPMAVTLLETLGVPVAAAALA